MNKENEFIKSEFCTECGGTGESVDEPGEQCFSCEDLHKAEIRADRMHDEMKGN